MVSKLVRTVMTESIPSPQTSRYHSAVMFEGFQGGPQLCLHDAERRQSLGQLYVWSVLFFSTGMGVVPSGNWVINGNY